MEVVLRHIKIVTERHSQLDRWTYPQTPVKVSGNKINCAKRASNRVAKPKVSVLLLMVVFGMMIVGNVCFYFCLFLFVCKTN